VVSFTPQTLYTWENSLHYPLARRLGVSQSRSGHSGEEKKNPCARQESNPGRKTRSLVTVLNL